MPRQREPKHVKALIDKHTVQEQLGRMGLLEKVFRGATMRRSDKGGTRNDGRGESRRHGSS